MEFVWVKENFTIKSLLTFKIVCMFHLRYSVDTVMNCDAIETSYFGIQIPAGTELPDDLTIGKTMAL